MAKRAPATPWSIDRAKLELRALRSRVTGWPRWDEDANLLAALQFLQRIGRRLSFIERSFNPPLLHVGGCTYVYAEQGDTMAGRVTGARVEIYQDKGRQWRYRKVAKNGQITNTPGEGYASRQGARRAAKREHPTMPIVSV
jgi:uncharacterized protein YegP (UPF0339 family)